MSKLKEATPEDIIKELFAIEINFDNESDDCELQWSQIIDLINIVYRKATKSQSPQPEEEK